MIVIRLEGGLGNQLFQYSYGLAMQAQHGERLVFDRRLVRDDPSKVDVLDLVADLDHDRFADRLVAVVLRLYAGMAIRTVRFWCGPTSNASLWLARLGIHHLFTPRYVNLNVDRLPFHYLHGNFMSEKFFQPFAARIRSSIHYERALGLNVQNLVTHILATNSVAIHVRRGDYLNDQWREKLHICNDEYYKQAVKIIQSRVHNPTFYVFSNSIDDMNWVRDNYDFLPGGTVFVEPGTTDVEHFALMASCRHLIISNSTFSWWASYLSTNEDKVVVAPSPWNRDAWDMVDIYRADWALVDLTA